MTVPMPTSDFESITPEPPEWVRRSVLRQRWAELAYFHWRYEPQVIQQLLPTGLRVDTFDGSAWVGLIPFEMRDVRVGPTPPVPWLGSFIEINVRTYVVDSVGRRSVWFFSFDVPRTAIVAVARSVFSLPYCWARADHTVVGAEHRYSMTRRWPLGHDDESPSADMAFRVGERIADDQASDLDHFLTARWGLITARRGRSLHGQVHHERWTLYAVDDVRIVQSVIEAAGIPAPFGEPHARYSPGVGVQVAWLTKI